MMRRYIVVVAVLVVCLGIAGCPRKSPQAVTEVTPAVAEDTGPAVEVNAPKSTFDVPYAPADVKASVAAYAAKADLSNVANRNQFGKLSKDQMSLIAKNAFVAMPTDEQQLFFIYEGNDYKNAPSFITTDSVLQVYHIFYDFTLRNVERDKLYGALQNLTRGMLQGTRPLSDQFTDPEWKKAASDNVVYFAVPYSLLGKTPIVTPEQKAVMTKELALVNAASGRTRSALFPWDPDYSQFIPRGHYTRTDQFKRYFRAMMWYGYMPFPILWPMDGSDTSGRSGAPDWAHIRQSLLITWVLFNTKTGDKPTIEAWKTIYEPTAFYVGTSDDLTPYQYKAVMDKVYGKDVTPAQLQDNDKLCQVFRELWKFALPKINARLYDVRPGKHMMPYGKLFKFMGQRYIPDSEMMQRLVSYPERPFPRGLDVMAVLGSERAADILDNVYKDPQRWKGYLPERNKLVKEFKALPQSTWQSNLYWGWLWTLDSLLGRFGKGYPTFMTNQAWEDKGLNSALGSWAELRHDTILYAKQSAVECGGAEEPTPPKGYVEPNVEFYNRLLWLTKASRTGLSKRGLISDEITEKFGDFEDLLVFLKDVSVKELKNQKLTEQEYYQIKYYGANLEGLTLSIMEGHPSNWYEITSETDKNMAVVADVHTSQASVLEEGVGHANVIYVVVPIQGRLYLTRGAVFSYYEFTHPASDRLTDEKWQQMLKQKKAPNPPDWTKSFLPLKGHEKPIPKEVYSSGC